MFSGFLDYNYGKIYYEVTGSGDSIIFIHGFTLDHSMWDEQVKYFSKNYQVITVDMRGFGSSSLPTNKYSYSNDLKALLDYLKVSKAHIVGLSLGGEESLNFALDYPECVISLTLISSSLGGYASTVDWDVKAIDQGIANAKHNWLNHEVFKSSKNYPEVFIKLSQMVNNYTGWHWLNSGYRMRPKIAAIERLEAINVDVLIVVGQLDLPYYHEISDILCRRIKHSKKVIATDCGHMLTMENSECFNDQLNIFLSSTMNQQYP